MCKFNWCPEIFEKRCSCDAKQKKNQKTSDANTCMSVSVFSAGINVNKIDEILASVGSITPAMNRSHEHYQKLKRLVVDLSKIELKKNRTEHCSKVRGMKDCRGDIVFEKNKIKHSCSCGSVVADGARSERV